jgi:hypothetical protein
MNVKWLRIAQRSSTRARVIRNQESHLRRGVASYYSIESLEMFFIWAPEDFLAYLVGNSAIAF